MNVLLIISDQHLATCLGVEGDPQVITPNLDRLAREGVRLRRAYTQSPICTPSRVSILSGQYSHNHGYFGLSGPAPHALPSFFSHFKTNHYRTIGIGNLHTPNDPRNWLEHHLDQFLDYNESVDSKEWQTPFYDNLRKLGLFEREDNRFFHRNPAYAMEGFPSPLPFELSQEGWCVQEATRLMGECRANNQPFCMQVALQRPHQPFTPDKKFWDMYPEDLDLPPTLNREPTGRPPHFRDAYDAFREMKWAIEPHTFEAGARRLWRGYLACITHVDYSVGLLLDYLDQSGLAKDTIVIYTADHGAYSGTYGIPEKAPGICSDAVCRVPSIWRVPLGTGTAGAGANGSRPGGTCEELTESIDIAPTITALCGLPPMDTVDGKDISALLRGKHEPVRDVAVTEHVWSKSLCWENWRFVHYQPEMFGGEDVGELYDLARDPDESRNLYHDPKCAEVVHQLRRLLLEWLIRTTRVKTVWPAPEWSSYPFNYHTAGDGKVANTAGAAMGLRKGELNYL